MLEKYNQTYETKHYLFHFKAHSLASKDILNISQTQEKCYEIITNFLKITPNFKINYYLI